MPYSRVLTAPVLPAIERAGPATQRVVRAKRAASNQLTLPARAPKHLTLLQPFVRGGKGYLANVHPQGGAWQWHTQGLQTGRGLFWPPDWDKVSSRRLL